MSRQNAELSEDFASTDSRLDAILAQLNALAAPGSAEAAPESPPAPPELAAAESPPAVPESAAPESPPAVPESAAPESPPAVPEFAAPPMGVAQEPKPPMPALSAPPRTLQSVPDLEPSLGSDEQVLDTTPIPDAIMASPDGLTSPPILGLVSPPVETALLAPPPVPTELIEPVESFAPLELEPMAPVEPAPVEITMAHDAPQVFVLDGPLETDTIAEDDIRAVPTAPPFPTESEFGAAAEADPGWVSHHTVEPVVPEVESTVPAAELSMVDLEPPVADIQPTFDEVEPTFDAPLWTEASEEIVQPESDFEPLTIDQTDVLPEGAEHHFSSDEDLPIPDFTGVWADSEEPTVWDNDHVPAELVPGSIDGGRSSSGISVGRNELDSLRPVDEEAVAKPPQNLGRKLQLVGVVLFGLIALAVMFLDDPAVIDELRDLYDGFFG